MNNRPTSAVVYARCSTLLAQDPESQLVHLRQFVQARNFELVSEYVDMGISGSRERRPALDEMVKSARLGKFKVIVVAGIDRLARDTRHLLNLLEELRGYGVSVISLRENIDFTTAMGQAALTIFGAVAQLERELIRERIKNALAAKKLAAEKTGSGWRCGRPTVVTKDVEVAIYKLRRHGQSLRQIAKSVGVAKTTVIKILKSGHKP
jgi:DNA invertase Pin-like site-specific DNA recombinase